MKSRAGLIILDEGQVALIRRVRENKTYYVFPGGGVEAGESPQEAAEREAMEELGVRIELGPAVYEVTGTVREQYFSASITGGEFGVGTGDEFSDPERGRGSYEAIWLPIDTLSEITVYPEALAAELIQRAAGKAAEE